MDVKQILQYRGPEKMGDGKESVAHYQHRHALRRQYNSPFGSPLRAMLEGWARYAAMHKDRYGTKVGDDGVLGDEWAEIGKGIMGLLDGDVGGWDCGSIHSNIRDLLLENSYEL